MLRVFAGRPWWATSSAAGIGLLSAVLYTWNIGYSGVSTYYAASAVSMSRSAHALAFGALDPGASITLDKLSGFLVPQALSVSIFGVHAWALSLPQALEGIVTILVVYAIGMRWRGPAVAVLAAAATAVTPMLAAMFGRPMEEGMLTMTAALAVLAAQRAAITGHGRWLLVAALWVGVGFQAKMLQAWFVIPAVLVLYLLGSGTPLRRRILWAATSIVASVAASVSWIAAMQLAPAADRPYVDGTTDNDFFSMVFGYNGVDRLIPGLVPGSVPQLDTIAASGAATRVGGAGHSLTKFLEPALTTQIGWLDVLAVAAILLELALLLPIGGALLARAREALPRNRLDLGMVAGLATWAVVTVLVLAPAFVPHATYFAPIAPALTLLAAAGAMDAIRLHRVPGWRMLAAGLAAASALWQVSIIAMGPPSLTWLAVPILAEDAVVVLLLARLGVEPRATPRRLVPVAAIATGALLAPAIWSSFVLGPGGGGSASDAYAGPRVSVAPVALAAASGAIAPASRPPLAPLLRQPFEVPPDLALTPAQRRLVSYTRARVVAGRPLFATDTLAIAVSVILTTRDDALPMGGFSREAPTPTLGQVRAMVGDGRLRFVLLADPATAGADAGPAAGPATDTPPPNATLSSVSAWTRSHCIPVLRGAFREDSQQTQTLYDCAPPADDRGTGRGR